MSHETVKMVLAVMMTAVLASTGTYVALRGDIDEEHNLFTSDFPVLELGDYKAASLYDAESPSQDSELRGFGSFTELKAFLERHAVGQGRYDYSDGVEGGVAEAASLGGNSAADSYTSTNIQVAGVDEGDIVKTDGRYAYIISSTSESVFIVDAYPPENAAIACEIESAGSFVDLYVISDRLVMLEQVYYFEGGFSASSYRYSDAPMVNVRVFDISNRSSPRQVNEAVLGGMYLTSRAIDGILYVIGSQYLQDWDNESQLPVPLESIYTMESGEESAYSMTNFLTLDISDDDSEPYLLSIMMDISNSIYVSEKNIYLTRTAYTYQPGLLYEGNSYESTVIHRISILGQDLKYRASGEVPGRVLNRFSMDEHQEHFRIATTKGQVWSSGEDAAVNMVYVLNMGMETVGKLESIAPGERIYSARFMGDRCYLVTYKKVDPFFVIDLKNPTDPSVLGHLKIPGYSDYLHPYDENHVIGLGKDTIESGNPNFEWYQGVKLALFNVTNVTNPTEIGHVIIGERGSDSLALSDPHAFTFSLERNLLIIPVYLYKESGADNGYKAMVFRISPEDGIVEQGTIVHEGQANVQYDYYYGGYYNTNSQIKRSFLIADTIYTVSDRMLKATSISGIELGVVELD